MAASLLLIPACASGTDTPLGGEQPGGDGGASSTDPGPEPPPDIALAVDSDGTFGPDEVGFVGAWAHDAGPGSEIALRYVDGNVCLSGETARVTDDDWGTYWGAEATLTLCADTEGNPRPVAECLGDRAVQDLVGFGFTLTGRRLPWLVAVSFAEAEREDRNSATFQEGGELEAFFSDASNYLDSEAPATSRRRVESITIRAAGSAEGPQSFDFCVEDLRALFGAEWQAIEIPDWLEAGDEPGQRNDYVGANLVGAEFGHLQLPGVHGTDYLWPSRFDIEMYAARGMNVFRVPFRWERMQPTLYEPLDERQLGFLRETIGFAQAVGATVIVDPHNFARYEQDPTDDIDPLVVGVDLETSAFADFWGRLAAEFANEDLVWFGLMNEPHTMETEAWLAAANAALAAIRNEGAEQLVLVPGNQWTGAHAWFADYYGTPNAEAMLGIEDPANHYALELHQYFDANYAGTSDSCVSETVGVEAVQPVTRWLREQNLQGFLGEFGGSIDPVCLKAVDNLLTHLGEHPDEWLGWTVWASTEWNIQHNVRPLNDDDEPLQLRVLARHLTPPE